MCHGNDVHRCVFGFPGSVHDARVFRDSPLFIDAERNRDQLFPGNSLLR